MSHLTEFGPERGLGRWISRLFIVGALATIGIGTAWELLSERHTIAVSTETANVGAIAGPPRERRLALERHQAALPVDRLRRDDHGFAPRQHRGCGRGLGIAGAQLARLQDDLALQQVFRVFRGQPAPVFGDADGHDFVFIFIDRVENRRGREQ